MLATDAWWRRAGVAKGRDELLAPDLLQMGDVRLVVVILPFLFSGMQHRGECTCTLAPWMDENGTLTAFSGATISSMRKVEFCRKVSGALMSQTLRHIGYPDTHSPQ